MTRANAKWIRLMAVIGCTTMWMASCKHAPDAQMKASSKIDCAIAWYTISELCSAEQFGTDIYEVRKQTGAGKGTKGE